MGTSEALVYIVYIKGELFVLSLVCTFEKAINNFGVKIDVQKGP